ncbi:CWC16 protein [Immersiella caudata]|uniref:Splicing factor YJU2 n=1 Tax=Immersiella caudata TaxID=314043 RepID=A0AA40C679_9PEZI|nr:CWC16 protein [Immersiella caudata]
MSERKVLQKYYPADFDPSLVGRTRAPKQAGPKVQTVRLMSPFSMRCTSCGEYLPRGRKFNARKETPVDEKYLNIQIYRFYIRCTRCSAEVVFRTDPKNNDYVVERGAKRNTDPWKRGLGEEEEESDEARLDRLEREMAEAEGEDVKERNAMAELEAKTADAKREMAVADALDEIRSRNARIEKGRREGVEAELSVVVPEDEVRRRQEEEDAEAARRAFARRHEMLEEVIGEELPPSNGNGEGLGSSNGAGAAVSSDAMSMPPPPKPTPAPSTEIPAPSFKRQVKKKKDHSALLGIKKKASLV